MIKLLYILYSLFILFIFISILHTSIFISILFLISLFFISFLIFLLYGFEFISFLYLIVYVGAIAVLFLFMVMLFDKSEYLYFVKKDIFIIKYKYFIFFIFSFFIFFFMSLNIIYSKNLDNTIYYCKNTFPFYFYRNIVYINFFTNLELIGSLLYTYYYISIIGASIILLIGMIGAIILTQMIPLKIKNKHQNIVKQYFRFRF